MTHCCINAAVEDDGATERTLVKFGIAFATTGPALDGDGLAQIASTAEQLGYDSLWSVEHVVVPVGYTSQYPYAKDGPPEKAAIPDPLIPLAYAAAVTSTIKLGTAAVVLPEHQPLRIAKALATLDRLSGGRVILGVGAGWLKEEYDALQIDFGSRGQRLEAMIDALRALWREGPCSFESEFFSWAAVESNPKPVQRGGIPIHIAGHAPVVARRAARIGDGFLPGLNSVEEFQTIIAVVREECERIGRDIAELELTAGCNIASYDVDTVRRFADAGANRVHCVAFGETAQEVCDQLRCYAETVMAEVGIDSNGTVAA